MLANAATGDTTTVQTFNELWLDHYGGFDTVIQFPDGSKNYRKVYMVFTLGKRPCPGYDPYNAGDGPGKTGWCGDWDYTVNNYLMTKNGDTVELARFITPYARQTAARTPMSWKERYVFDVTDFYPLLKDSATYRINYSGYSWGFTASVSFIFIEGTPARNVLGIDRLWHGYFGYGGTTSIEANMPQLTRAVPASTQASELKFNVSGHGSDGGGCSEFCKKYYQVKLNGTQIDQKDIWRDNCGSNHLYPQSGTWLYDRGNWCPGDIVHTNTHKLSGLTAGSNYDIDVDFEAYTRVSGGSGPGYGVDAAVIHYGAMNHALDASLEDIISPNIHEMHFRKNTLSDKPQVVVRNTGSTPITSIKFDYGVNGSTNYTHTWNGSLAALDTVTVTLSELFDLRSVKDSNNTFVVKMTQVNGTNDEDNSNNSMQSRFVAAPVWPKKVMINFRTNNIANETSWKIVDALNNVVAQRDGVSPNTTYTDSATFGPGAYRLIVTDLGCDGLYFWNNSAGGSGTLTFRAPGTFSYLPLEGYFGGDFGCGFTQSFTYSWANSIAEEKNIADEMRLYPNPAANTTHLSIASSHVIRGKLIITDVLGKQIKQIACNSLEQDIITTDMPNGVYTIWYIDDNARVGMQTKLVVTQ